MTQLQGGGRRRVSASGRPPRCLRTRPRTWWRTGISRLSIRSSCTARIRLNKKIKRRSKVVAIFPTPQSVTSLVGAILLEQEDEWDVPERRYFNAKSMPPSDGPGDFRRDRMRRSIGVGACGRPHSRFSRQRWTVVYASTAAAAPTPSNSGKTCAIYTFDATLP